MTIKVTPVEWQINGLVIRGIRWGNPQGYPVLLVHGWLDNCLTFYRLTQLLTDWNCVAIDLPGHGLSDHKGTELHFYSVIDSVTDLVELLESYFPVPTICIGHSLGAGLLALAAGLSPELVSQLVLFDGIAPLPATAEELPSRFHSFRQDKKRLSQRSLSRFFSLEEAAIRRSHVGSLDMQLARVLTERSLRLEGDFYTWTYDPRLKFASILRLTPEQIAVCLRAIRCPVLLLRATNSHIAINEELMAKAASCIPQLKTITLNGGHYIHHERAVEVAKLISTFIDKNKRNNR